MKLKEALKAKVKSRSYWLGGVKALAYPLIDVAVDSTATPLDDAGAQLGKQFIEQLLGEPKDGGEAPQA